MEAIKVLDVKINRVDLIEAVNRVDDLIQLSGSNLVLTPNSEMVVLAQQDRELKQILNQAELTIPDGSGLLVAARLLGRSLKERVTGIDLMKQLLALAAQENYSIYFLGAKPEVIQQARHRVVTAYPELKIVGVHHGYLDSTTEAEVIKEINDQAPDLLFVGMGAPLQEKWLSAYRDKLDFSVGMGVGGSFDILAEQKTRAPQIIQQLGLEWLYRLLQEPSRWRRMLALPTFIYLVSKERVLN
ncbi:MAG: WecB/TagA/CpsF family glycosyltransferase [Bacillota bacterium]